MLETDFTWWSYASWIVMGVFILIAIAILFHKKIFFAVLAIVAGFAAQEYVGEMGKDKYFDIIVMQDGEGEITPTWHENKTGGIYTYNTSESVVLRRGENRRGTFVINDTPKYAFVASVNYGAISLNGNIQDEILEVIQPGETKYVPYRVNFMHESIDGLPEEVEVPENRARVIKYWLGWMHAEPMLGPFGMDIEPLSGNSGQGTPIPDNSAVAGLQDNLDDLFSNLTFPENHEKAVQSYRRGCDRGYLYGCFKLAKAYQTGLGVNKDTNRAFALNQKACHGGEPSACTALGSAYANGRGVSKNATTAVRYYQIACDERDANGCGNLGTMYRDGRGVEKDTQKAYRIFTSACAQGATNGCLGSRDVIFLADSNSPQDRIDRVFTEEKSKSCLAGDAMDCFHRGTSLRLGWGVDKNNDRAAQAFLAGCNQGNPQSCFAMAVLFEEGRVGAGPEYPTAGEAYRLSCAFGQERGFTSGCKVLETWQY